MQPLERRLLLSSAISHLPYQGVPQGVPGTIEFENYDTGGEGVSFHNPAPSQPNPYRQDSVDVQSTSDAGGGYSVGSTTPGEWLNYTINVASSTVYSLSFRVASGSSGGTIHVNLDGVNSTGPVQISNTGGWQNWTTVTVPNVSIPAGEHVLTLSIDSAASAGSSVGNFNWLQLADTPATSPRTQWWRDAKFGMFIHWGLYSQLAGHWNGQTTSGLGEWIMNDLNIPPAQYAQVASQFNPTQFNAQQWVQIAQDAGMKYIVMTSKHHDGFSMFNTSVNNYNVVADTPWHQDPIAQMSQAAHAAGLHFGVYYSILNWSDPNASAAGIDKYMVTMKTQLKELITNDHPEILWFDGDWPSWWTAERGRELTEFVRNLDPAIILNDRIGGRAPTAGDFTTPEQTIPTSEPPGRLWETCMTLNDTWGYKDTDNNWKSASTIVNNLQQINAAGGNYLLNVGPTGQGIIPAPAVQILQQVGQALGVNTGSTGGGGAGGTGSGGTGTAGTGTGNTGGSGGGSGTTGGTGGTGTGGSTSNNGGTTPVTSPNPPTSTISFSARQKAVYIDSHGSRITVTMHGPGAGQLAFQSAGSDVSQILLDGTDGRSVVSVRGNTSVGDVLAGGSLGALLAPTSAIAGNVTVGGNLQRLQIGGATGGHAISASAIGSVIVRGDLADNLTAGTIGRVMIGRMLSGSAIHADNSIGAISAAGAAASEVFAGVRSDLKGLPASADLSNQNSSIHSFVIRGRGIFSNTEVAAGTIGAASLGSVQSDNRGTPFGVAAHQIKSLRATVSGRLKTLRSPRSSTTLGGDAIVRIL